MYEFRSNWKIKQKLNFLVFVCQAKILRNNNNKGNNKIEEVFIIIHENYRFLANISCKTFFGTYGELQS